MFDRAKREMRRRLVVDRGLPRFDVLGENASFLVRVGRRERLDIKDRLGDVWSWLVGYTGRGVAWRETRVGSFASCE
jgi:hypothetical protein